MGDKKALMGVQNLWSKRNPDKEYFNTPVE